MGFTQYLKRVLFRDSDGNGYVIPVTNLSVWYEPWHATGKTIVRYFHGKNSARIQGYQGFCEFDMNFGYQGEDDATLSAWLNAITTNTVMTIDFDPDIDPGQKTMIVILDDVRGSVGATHDTKIRNRRVTLKLIDPTIQATIPAWIVGTTPASIHSLFDAEDLLIYLPESIVGGLGNPLTKWTNLGSQGTIGDLTTQSPGASGPPGEIKTDSNIGETVGFTADDQSKSTAGTNVVSPIDGDFDSEMWIVVKVPSTGTISQICSFGQGGPTTNWLHSTDKFFFSTGSIARFTTCPPIYEDGQWHVYRSIHNLVGSATSLAFLVDGYPLGFNDALSGGLTRLADEAFWIGPGQVTSNGFQYEFAMVKLTEGISDAARAKAIYAYLRDTWGITSIPADGTVTVAFTGDPLGAADINVTPFLVGASTTILDNGGSTVDLGRCIRKDNNNEWIFYAEGRSLGRLLRADYTGGNQLRITTTNPTGGSVHGIALNIVSNECYVTHDTNGEQISLHSLDIADAAVAWTNLLGSGTYEIWQAIEYNPNDDLIYFIDSLAATPTLRTITTAGASDTLVKSLTAGKVYGFLVKDPDANVLYFTNETDATIEKYNIDTDTWTTSWHVPTNRPNGLDIQGGKLWYFEETTGKIYEVTLTTPGSKTDLGTDTLASDWGGLAVVVFDTTV